MEERHARSAEEARQRIARGAHDRFGFRAALLAVPFAERDAWLDRVLGLGALPDDGAELPPGCVPYLPCSVDALIEIVDRAQIGPDDCFVDVGSGLGRATALVHLLSGAAAIGIEIQKALVDTAREIARGVSSRIESVHGDAVDLAGSIVTGTVYFLYCPFSGERLRRVLDELAAIARRRPIRVCCVDLPLPECAWLVEVATSGGLTIYRSALS
jgi:SAM-dependent methyltransferase